jgi:hypothetical protein
MMIQKEQIVLNLNQSIQKTIHTQEFQGWWVLQSRITKTVQE